MSVVKTLIKQILHKFKTARECIDKDEYNSAKIDDLKFVYGVYKNVGDKYLEDGLILPLFNLIGWISWQQIVSNLMLTILINKTKMGSYGKLLKVIRV